MTALLAAHGWLMLLGWFVALPLAAASARFLRPLAAEPSDASWLRSHQRWAYVAALCVLVGLILAVADGERHLRSTHSWLGLVASLLFLVQLGSGLVRPAPTSARRARCERSNTPPLPSRGRITGFGSERQRCSRGRPPCPSLRMPRECTRPGRAAKRARMMPAAGAIAHRRLLSSLSACFGMAAAFTGLHVMRSRGGFTAAPLCDDHGSADDGGSAHHARWSAPTLLLSHPKTPPSAWSLTSWRVPAGKSRACSGWWCWSRRPSSPPANRPAAHRPRRRPSPRSGMR